MDNINLNCAPPCEPLKAVKEQLENPIYGLVALHNKIDAMNEKMDKKYAGKWVERFAVSVITIFALSALYFIFEKVGLPH